MKPGDVALPLDVIEVYVGDDDLVVIEVRDLTGFVLELRVVAPVALDVAAMLFGTAEAIQREARRRAGKLRTSARSEVNGLQRGEAAALDVPPSVQRSPSSVSSVNSRRKQSRGHRPPVRRTDGADGPGAP